MNILLIAEAFGFGPAASLMCCKAQLAAQDHNWRYAGPAFTRPLIHEDEFEAALFMPDDFDMSRPELGHNLDWADLVISGTEFRALEPACRRGTKIILYDPLAWFWEQPVHLSHKRAYYVCPNFPGVDVAGLSLRHGDRFRVVRPYRPAVTRQRRNGARDSGIILNLCGLRNPVCILNGYYEFLIEAAIRAFNPSEWGGITVTGNQELLQQLQGRYPSLGFEAKRHADMIRSVSAASLLLTSPGLNSSLEAMALGVPVGFLPPQNNSQAAQLELFQASGVAPVSMDWDAISHREWEWKRHPPLEAIRTLHRAMDWCKRDDASAGRLVGKLTHMAEMKPAEWEAVQARQDAFFNGLCRDAEDFTSAFDHIAND